MKTPTQWPKPSSVPWSSLAFTLLDVGIFFLLSEIHVSIYWMIPIILLNVFFFIVERDIYRREKRNYDSWNKEMGYLMGVTDREGNLLKQSFLDNLKKQKSSDEARKNKLHNGPQTN